MGHIFAEIKLSNPRNPNLTPIVAQALADTGALMLCIPEHIALQLDLEMESKREVTVADGRSMNVPYVGPIKVGFRDRFCYVGALVLGDEVLLGAAFDYHAGTIKRALKWMQDCCLEWFYRLATEPRRLWKRYLVTNTLFVLGATRQLLCDRNKSKRA